MKARPLPSPSWPGFGTKAETLEWLGPRLKRGVVPRLTYFTLADWTSRPAALLKTIARRFGRTQIAVRSSAVAEDGERNSNAGAFRSCLGVAADNPVALGDAIAKVVASMPGNPRDQVLVQTMLVDVAVSGVVMTYDMTHGAPYYVIDYDDESGRTDLVTGGNGLNKGLYVYRNAKPGLIRSPRIRRFLELARELEALTGHPALDIEFGMDRTGALHLLQVRPITLAHTWHPNTERRVARQLGFVEEFLRERGRSRPGVLGTGTLLAVMPDWNPAEIIGTTPRPLAASLYRELITRSVWREARALMGYRPLATEELMVSINNHPYIDVRASFNSFLPDGVNDADGTLLVDAWMHRLAEHPELHDKVEFQIVPTCRDFSFDADFKTRYPGLLPPRRLAHYRSLLTTLTRRCLDRHSSLLPAISEAQLLAKALDARTGRNESSDLARAAGLIGRCRRQGTLPFAVVARHAFIAEALLRSAVGRGALPPERLDAFRAGIATVTSTMVAEYAAVLAGRSSRQRFLSRYGHLRPGTYEVSSLRYDERDDLFLDAPTTLPKRDAAAFTLTAKERRALRQLLAEAGLDDIAPDDLLTHARIAIAGREEVKFIFSRALSDALATLQRWATCQGISRDDLSYIDWPTLETRLVQAELDDADRSLLKLAEEGRRLHEASHAFRLGHIIGSERDIHVATINRSIPNFVGSGRAAGPVVELTPRTPATVTTEGRMVCIENADPGFDWLFTKRPAALITKFGGANSHMAIRCAEFGLPAAIGCGEQIYARVATATAAELNCAERILRPLHGR